MKNLKSGKGRIRAFASHVARLSDEVEMAVPSQVGIVLVFLDPLYPWRKSLTYVQVKQNW